MNILFTARVIPLQWNKLRSSLFVPLFISLMVIITDYVSQFLTLPVSDLAKNIFIMGLCLIVVIVLIAICRRQLLAKILIALKTPS